MKFKYRHISVGLIILLSLGIWVISFCLYVVTISEILSKKAKVWVLNSEIDK